MWEVSPLGLGGTSPTGQGICRAPGARDRSGQRYSSEVARSQASPRSLPLTRRSRRVGWLVAVLALAAPLGLAACGSSGPPTPSDPVLAQGQQIYSARCASCHGADGGGGIAPALAGRMTERFPDPADQIALIAGGVPGTSMRAFEDVLSAEEIDAVVRYTRESLNG